ncbi:MAG: DHH family phosphoesterase [Actinomycetota bacterium]
MIPEDQWEKAVDTLRSSTSVAVCCHILPDGDALGSMIGLGLVLRRLGKKVWMSWGAPQHSVPTIYEFMPGIDELVDSGEVPDEAEAFIAIDCGDMDRLAILQDKFKAAGTTINIDHHVSNPRFAAINLVDHSRASSSELAYELVKRMGVVPNVEEATCLYTGIVTDTGRFQYSNASPDTLRVAAELRETGLDHRRIAEEIYESMAFHTLSVLGVFLARAKLEDGVVYSWLELKDLGSMALEEADDFIDFIRVVREAKVAAVFKQVGGGMWKGSLRSRGDLDVSAIAKAFGGGGHRKAAGFTLKGTLEEVVFAVRKAVAEG